MSFCPNCGNRLNDNEKFCPQCGQPVAVRPAPAAAEQPPAAAPVQEHVMEQPAVEQAPAEPVSEPVFEQPAVEQAPAEPVQEPVFEQPYAAGTAPAAPVTEQNNSFVKKMLLIVGGVIAALLIVCGILAVVAIQNPTTETFPDDPYDELDELDELDDLDDDWDYDDDDSDDTYYDGAFFSVEVPDDWCGHYGVKETADSAIFYNLENDAAGYGGILVTITRYADNSYENLPDYQVVDVDSTYTYVAVFPTDVQFSMDDVDLIKLYTDMFNEVRDDFLEDIVFTGQNSSL